MPRGLVGFLLLCSLAGCFCESFDGEILARPPASAKRCARSLFKEFQRDSTEMPKKGGACADFLRSSGACAASAAPPTLCRFTMLRLEVSFVVLVVVVRVLHKWNLTE